jgi:hypothetical protein
MNEAVRTFCWVCYQKFDLVKPSVAVPELGKAPSEQPLKNPPIMEMKSVAPEPTGNFIILAEIAFVVMLVMYVLSFLSGTQMMLGFNRLPFVGSMGLAFPVLAFFVARNSKRAVIRFFAYGILFVGLTVLCVAVLLLVTCFGTLLVLRR